MEKTYFDEKGEFIVRYKGGKKIKVYIGQTISEAMKESGKFNFSKNNDNKIQKILASKEMLNEVNKIVDEHTIKSCNIVSEKVVEILKEKGIESSVENVTPFYQEEYSTNGHYVVRIKNKLYDYTGSQYYDKEKSNVELRVYENNYKKFYSRKPIKKVDFETEFEIAMNYTKDYPNEIILLTN